MIITVKAGVILAIVFFSFLTGLVLGLVEGCRDRKKDRKKDDD